MCFNHYNPTNICSRLFTYWNGYSLQTKILTYFCLKWRLFFIYFAIFFIVDVKSEVQRKAEMVMREQVLQGFEEQRALVDALTNVSLKYC